MTWNEFKRKVDALLKEKGISPDLEIGDIDLEFNDREIQVEIDRGHYRPDELIIWD